MSASSPFTSRDGNARVTLDRLVTAASLPPVTSTYELDEQGFDNRLLVGRLADGRHVLLRQNSEPGPAPVARARFLARHDVGAPQLYAADNAGALLVEFVPGETLAAMANRKHWETRYGGWSGARTDGFTPYGSRHHFGETSAHNGSN